MPASFSGFHTVQSGMGAFLFRGNRCVLGTKFNPPPPTHTLLAHGRAGSCRLNSDDTGLCEGTDLNCSFTSLKQQADGLQLPALFFVLQSWAQVFRWQASLFYCPLALAPPPPRVFCSPSPPFLFSPLCSPFLPFSWAPLSSPVLPSSLPLFLFSVFASIKNKHGTCKTLHIHYRERIFIRVTLFTN